MDQFLERSRVMGCNQPGGVWLHPYYFQEAEPKLNKLQDTGQPQSHKPIHQQ
jgi:hypothetical protein